MLYEVITVLLDVLMPGMDGMQVLERIKAQHRAMTSGGHKDAAVARVVNDVSPAASKRNAEPLALAAGELVVV